jgi:DNA repair exonuclease SbcCD ATPase subunit
MAEHDVRIPVLDSAGNGNAEIIELKKLTDQSRRRADQVWLMYALWSVAAVVVLLAIALPVLRKFSSIDQKLRDAYEKSERLQNNVVDLQTALARARTELQSLENTNAAQLQKQITDLKQSKADDHATQLALGKKADRDAVDHVLIGKVNTIDLEQRLTQVNQTIASKVNTNDLEQRVAQLNQAIASKANTSDLEQRVTQMNGAIASKVSTSDLEQRVQQLNQTIASKVGMTDLEPRLNQLNQAIASKASADELRRGLDTKLDKPPTGPAPAATPK